MKQILLTQNKYTLVDDDDYEWLTSFKWFATKRQRTTGKDLWYAAKMHKSFEGVRSMQYMHRFILGITDSNILVDHADHTHFGGLDNRRVNLRIASRTEQNRNVRKQSHLNGMPTSSRYKGVYLDKRRNIWYAEIKVNRKKIFLGGFKNEEDAARAYDTRASELFGEFVIKNFPEARS